ncbi:unnamed protein product [Pedinophyceae sp. YPF-701]|nr:unnamed protein product [Pedinophyceae sp. YPF-701]
MALFHSPRDVQAALAGRIAAVFKQATEDTDAWVRAVAAALGDPSQPQPSPAKLLAMPPVKRTVDEVTAILDAQTNPPPPPEAAYLTPSALAQAGLAVASPAHGAGANGGAGGAEGAHTHFHARAPVVPAHALQVVPLPSDTPPRTPPSHSPKEGRKRKRRRGGVSFETGSAPGDGAGNGVAEAGAAPGPPSSSDLQWEDAGGGAVAGGGSGAKSGARTVSPGTVPSRQWRATSSAAQPSSPQLLSSLHTGEGGLEQPSSLAVPSASPRTGPTSGLLPSFSMGNLDRGDDEDESGSMEGGGEDGTGGVAGGSGAGASSDADDGGEDGGLDGEGGSGAGSGGEYTLGGTQGDPWYNNSVEEW